MGDKAMEPGKTALVLGGGGSRGAYEMEVWQALRELDISIDLVTGTSIGAIPIRTLRSTLSDMGALIRIR